MGQAELDRFVGRELDGRYRVEEVIGTGGFGAVYRGVGLRLPVPVAIKVLGRPGVYDVRPAGHARRFELEARTTCLLQHPHIVRVFDFGATDDGLLYIVMEHLRGETLGALVARLGSLPVDRACHVAAQIALALAEAHGRGVVHRDLPCRPVWDGDCPRRDGNLAPGARDGRDLHIRSTGDPAPAGLADPGHRRRPLGDRRRAARPRHALVLDALEAPVPRIGGQAPPDPP